MELNDLMRAIEAILFAAGERVEIGRLAQTLEVDPKDIVQATDTLAELRIAARRGHTAALAEPAAPLEELAGKLHAFAEAHA